MDDFILEQAQPRSQQKPRNDKREESRPHARQKGQTRFAMGGKANEGNEGDGQNIAADKNKFVHEKDGVQRLQSLVSWRRSWEASNFVVILWSH